MMSALYRGLTTAFSPAIDGYLRARLRRGKEDPARFAERLGRAGRPRPGGALVWLHAASVGETTSVLPLIDRLLDERGDLHLLLTSGTVSSARLLAGRLPTRAVHQYVPVDRPDAVGAFLAHWRPGLGIWIESELWPTLIGESVRRGIPLALINARMSARSYRRWRLLPFVIAPLLRAFTLCLAQSETDAGRLRRLGAEGAGCVGNLKTAVPPLGADPAELARLETAMAGRPRWLAASTHPGEEAVAAEAHRALARQRPGLMTLLVPRHAERGAAIAEALEAAGLSVARRSAGTLPAPQHDVFLGDSMGEMGLYYRLAQIVFVGGSLIEHGGQNPLEPARLDSALLLGPHTFNFADAVAELRAAGALAEVRNAGTLGAAVAALLDDTALCRARRDAAAGVAARGGEVLDAVLDRLRPLLPAAER